MRHEDQRHRVGKEMFLHTLDLKEWTVWNWVLSKNGDNQLHPHTSLIMTELLFRKQTALRFWTMFLLLSLLTTAESPPQRSMWKGDLSQSTRYTDHTRIHARRTEKLLLAAKYFPDCSMKKKKT